MDLKTITVREPTKRRRGLYSLNITHEGRSVSLEYENKYPQPDWEAYNDRVNDAKMVVGRNFGDWCKEWCYDTKNPEHREIYDWQRAGLAALEKLGIV